MRQIGLVLFGVFLLALDGALCRVLHLELMRPNPVLLLDVFIALNLTSAEGAVMVFLLGVSADSFAGTPMGMLASVHLFVWMLVRWSLRFLIPERKGMQLVLLFVMSLVFSLLVMPMLAIMEASVGPVWASFKVMLPLALVHLLLAGPVWAVARWIRRPVDRRRSVYTQ
jgi:rod shape-determining protein MreD